VRAVRLHAQVQRLQAAQGEEGVEGTLHATGGVLKEGHLFGQLRVVADHGDSTDDVGVTVEVLGRRVQDDIGAKCQRTLDDGGAESVVDHHQQAAAAGDRGDLRDVHKLQERVGGGLDPDHLRLGTDR